MVAPAIAAHPEAEFIERFTRFGSEPCTANNGKRFFYERLNDDERDIVKHAAQRVHQFDEKKAHSLAVLTAQAAMEYSGLHGSECAFSQALNDREERAMLLANCVPHVAGMHAVKQWLNLPDTHRHLEPGVYLPSATLEGVTRGGRG